jgi:hypothetical protein
MNGQRPRRWRGDRQDRRPPLGRARAPDANPEVEQRIRELDSDREPMSLAEEIAIEARQAGGTAPAGSVSRSQASSGTRGLDAYRPSAAGDDVC